MQDFNACFGNGEVIALCDMNVTMPHLIAKQVRGRVQLRHHGSVSVTEIMIFEVDTELAFDFP